MGKYKIKNKAIFFDRDGIINKSIIRENKPYPPKDLSEFVFVEGIKFLISQLKQKNYLLFIITNQPDVSRKTQTKENVETINKYIQSNLPIDEIFTCFHDDKDNCECRKPKSGMILEAAKKYNIDLKKSWVIGDRWKDIESGNNAECKTIFVDYCYDEKLKSKPNYIVKSIDEIKGVIK